MTAKSVSTHRNSADLRDILLDKAACLPNEKKPRSKRFSLLEFLFPDRGEGILQKAQGKENHPGVVYKLVGTSMVPMNFSTWQQPEKQD